MTRKVKVSGRQVETDVTTKQLTADHNDDTAITFPTTSPAAAFCQWRRHRAHNGGAAAVVEIH